MLVSSILENQDISGCISADGAKAIHEFSSNNDTFLSVAGIRLKQQCVELHKFCCRVSQLSKEKEGKQLRGELHGTIVGPDKFLNNFLDIYHGKHGTSFKKSLVCGLMTTRMVSIYHMPSL